jgi:HPt (histidine-containing phosphotransfer) domain-containing protein
MDTSQPSSPEEIPLLNLRQLRSFIVYGHADFLELLEDMRKDIPKQFSAIREAMIAGDAEESSAAAHSSRGILSYFGCVALNQRLAAIELLETLEPSQAEGVFEELTTLWTDTLAAIKEWESAVPEFNP